MGAIGVLLVQAGQAYTSLLAVTGGTDSDWALFEWPAFILLNVGGLVCIVAVVWLSTLLFRRRQDP